MGTKEDVRAICRADLMKVELAIVRTYTTLLAGHAPYIAIDGGAHAGYHTERLGRLRNCGRVIAVEADPFTVVRLRSRVDLFDEALKAKIEVVEAALQEDAGLRSVTWMSSPSHPGRSGISSIWQNDHSVQFREKMTVAATTLDSLAASLSNRVGVIKLDLEGGDFMAIKGAVETLRRDRPYIVFENSNRAPGIYGFSIGEFADLFSSIGYKPLTFFGESATEGNWFDFWEMWAAPEEREEEARGVLETTIQELAEGALG